MAKPICVIKIDLESIYMDGNRNKWHVFQEMFEKKMPDYYTFVLPLYRVDDCRDVFYFQVFYEKDFTEIQYKELRELIESSVKTIHHE